MLFLIQNKIRRGTIILPVTSVKRKRKAVLTVALMKNIMGPVFAEPQNH